MAALGRPQPYRLQTSRPQVGLGPLEMEEGKPKASTLFRFFFALQFWQVYPPTLSAHCFCTFFLLFFVFLLFFAFFSLVFRSFFTFFLHFTRDILKF